MHSTSSRSLRSSGTFERQSEAPGAFPWKSVMPYDLVRFYFWLFLRLCGDVQNFSKWDSLANQAIKRSIKASNESSHWNDLIKQSTDGFKHESLTLVFSLVSSLEEDHCKRSFRKTLLCRMNGQLWIDVRASIQWLENFGSNFIPTRDWPARSVNGSKRAMREEWSKVSVDLWVKTFSAWESRVNFMIQSHGLQTGHLKEFFLFFSSDEKNGTKSGTKDVAQTLCCFIFLHQEKKRLRRPQNEPFLQWRKFPVSVPINKKF